MNAARQISRRFGRTKGVRTRFAADYSITATLSVVPDPLKSRLHWGCFREFLKKKSLDGLAGMSKGIDFDLCADLLDRLSDWVSYEHSKEELRLAFKCAFKECNEPTVEGVLSICKSPENVSIV